MLLTLLCYPSVLGFLVVLALSPVFFLPLLGGYEHAVFRCLLLVVYYFFRDLLSFRPLDWLLSLFDVPLLYLFIEYFMMNLVNPITWGSFFDVLLSLIGPLTLIAEGCCVLRMIYTIPRRAIEQSENEESTKGWLVIASIFAAGLSIYFMYGIFAFDRLTLAYVGYSTFSLALAFSTFFIALSKDGGLPSDPVFIVCYASYVLYSITLVPTNTGPPMWDDPFWNGRALLPSAVALQEILFTGGFFTFIIRLVVIWVSFLSVFKDEMPDDGYDEGVKMFNFSQFAGDESSMLNGYRFVRTIIVFAWVAVLRDFFDRLYSFDASSRFVLGDAGLISRCVCVTGIVLLYALIVNRNSDS